MEYGTISNDRDGQIDLQNEEETTKTIIVNILKFSFASSVGCVTIFLIEMINIAYAGGFNDLSVLAGVGLANITVNVVAISVIFGMNGALETFVAQSYGLKDSYLCSVFLNRGRFINTIAFVPIALILYNIESILIRFGQNEIVAGIASKYVRSLLPGVFFNVQHDTNRIFLTAIGMTYVPMLLQIVGTFLHVLWCYIFLHIYGFGVEGLGIASSLTFFIWWVGTMVYSCTQKEIQPMLLLPDKQTFKEIIPYLKLAIPSFLLFAADWCAYEVLLLIACSISIEATAIQVILQNFYLTMTQIPTGFQYTASTFIGQSIGQGNVAKARKYAKYIMLLLLLETCILSLLFIILRNQIVLIYIDSDQIYESTGYGVIIMQVSFIFDCIQLGLNGIVKGRGLQIQSFLLFVICVYFVSIPLAYYFAKVVSHSYIGLWIGLPVGYVILDILLLILLKNTDWTQVCVAQKAIQEKKIIAERKKEQA